MTFLVNEFGYKVRPCDGDCTNAFMVQGADFVGKWGMPLIPTKFDSIPETIVEYPERKKFTGDKSKAALAFFKDDMLYDQRNGIWNTATPDDSNRYGFHYSEIKDYEYIICPDYSVFENYPPSVSLDQVRRARYFGYWMYTKGKKILFNFRYLNQLFDEFVFDGIPVNCVPVIGTVGMCKEKENHDIILRSFANVHRLNPRAIIVYGTFDKDMKSSLRTDCPVYVFQPSNWRKEGSLYGKRQK